MKKLFFVLALAAALAVPTGALAASFISGQTVLIDDANRPSGNVYTAGGSVDIDVPVPGDIYTVGGSVTINNIVSGDVTAAGGTIRITAPVRGDVRVAGGTITLGSTVDGDLVILGGTVTLLSDSIVSGDVTIMGGKASLAGTVGGSVLARTQDGFTLGSNARINGTLTYRAPHQITPPAGVLGEVIYESAGAGLSTAKYGPKAILLALAAFLTALKMLAYLGAVIVAVWLFRKFSLTLFQDMLARWWPSVGRGLAYLILVPIAAAILCVTVIGLLPGLLAFLAYGAVMLVAKVLVGMFFGAWLVMKFRKQQALQVTWLNAIGGLLAYQFLGLIPLIGWVAQALLFLAVFGALSGRVQKMVGR